MGVLEPTYQSNGDVIFVARAAKTRSNHSVFNCKKICTHSIHWINSKTLGKARVGVSLPAVYVSSPDVKSEQEYIEEHFVLRLCFFVNLP